MYKQLFCADTAYVEPPLKKRVRKFSESASLIKLWDLCGHNLDAIPNKNIAAAAFSTSNSPQAFRTLNQGLVLMGTTLQVFKAIASTLIIVFAILSNYFQGDYAGGLNRED